MRPYLSIIAFSALPATVIVAQGPAPRTPSSGTYLNGSQSAVGPSVIRGQISSENPIAGALMIELTSPDFAGRKSTSVEPDGTFQISGLAPGLYSLRVTGAFGQVLCEESVPITGGYQFVNVHIPGKSNSEASTDATVSVKQLQHKAPAQAQKELKKGKVATGKSDLLGALNHYRNAARIDPQFADALTGIGISDIALGQLDDAAVQLRKAIDLVPDHRLALANLSIVLYRLQKYHEGEQMARRALRLDPSLLQIRYILGFTIIKENGDKAEALKNLERAAAEIPQAHLLAAKILAETNRRNDAVEHLVEYLRSPPGDGVDRREIEAWLKQLRQ